MYIRDSRFISTSLLLLLLYSTSLRVDPPPTRRANAVNMKGTPSVKLCDNSLWRSRRCVIRNWGCLCLPSGSSVASQASKDEGWGLLLKSRRKTPERRFLIRQELG